MSRTFYLPSRFTRLPEVPLRVRVRGSFPRVPLLAVVGSRRPTKSALASVPWIIDAAVSSGWGVVSGGARGIDARAHHECLSRRGVTVAVLGSGLSRLYPPEHSNLFGKIVEQGGCLLSEYEDDAPPRPWRFPQRNRLISALSEAVMVVQAAEKSGGLVTARIAAEVHGKDVLAVPGSVGSPEWAGSNRLLRDGALLVADQGDLLAALSLLQSSTEANPQQDEEDAGSSQKDI